MSESHSNMPILYQNLLHPLKSELAEDVFLWAAELSSADRYQYRAEALARKIDLLVETLEPFFSFAIAQHKVPPENVGDIQDDLMKFVVKRAVNYFEPTENGFQYNAP